MLLASDAAVGAFGVVISGVIAGAVAIILKALDRTDRKLGDPRLGDTQHGEQGHTSISSAVGHLATQQSVILARLDAQDEQAKTERAAHVEGQQRQEMIRERQEKILDAVDEIRATQLTFVTRDEFAPIVAALDRLNALIGDAQPGWDPRPVLPYVHETLHEIRDELTKVGLANSLLASQVVALSRQVNALSNVLDVPLVEPDLSDTTTEEQP